MNVFCGCSTRYMQSDEFLGRKLAKRMKTREGGEAPSDNVVAGEDTDTVEILGRERRKDEERLDVEVIDDRELYQHLLKVAWIT